MAMADKIAKGDAVKAKKVPETSKPVARKAASQEEEEDEEESEEESEEEESEEDDVEVSPTLSEVERSCLEFNRADALRKSLLLESLSCSQLTEKLTKVRALRNELNQTFAQEQNELAAAQEKTSNKKDKQPEPERKAKKHKSMENVDHELETPERQVKLFLSMLVPIISHTNCLTEIALESAYRPHEEAGGHSRAEVAGALDDLLRTGWNIRSMLLQMLCAKWLPTLLSNSISKGLAQGMHRW